MEHQTWFRRGALDPASLRVLDQLRVGETTVSWARVDGAGDGTVLVLAEDDPTLLAAVLTLATRRSWTTAAGATVRWHGPLLDRPVLGELLTTNVSNAVARIGLGTTPADGAVLKVYRALGDDRGEAALLSELAGRAPLPQPLGRLEYLPADGVPRCLALVTRAVVGESLDSPLRRALRAHPAGDVPPRLLGAVREALAELHRQLADGRPAVRRPLPERLPGLTALSDAVRRTLPPGGGRRAALLDRCLTLARARASGADYPVGPRHGDLHLAHVLVDQGPMPGQGTTDQAPTVRFIDPDGSAAPGASPLDDLAALRRAVECFAADEETARSALAQRHDKHRYTRELRQAALDPHPAQREPRAPGSRWARSVADQLTAGVREAELVLPYLLRTLHELRHHGERAGDPVADYYADLTWIALAEFTASQEAQPAPEPATQLATRPAPEAEPDAEGSAHP